jgi:hypothetical protein
MNTEVLVNLFQIMRAVTTDRYEDNNVKPQIMKIMNWDELTSRSRYQAFYCIFKNDGL